MSVIKVGAIQDLSGNTDVDLINNIVNTTSLNTTNINGSAYSNLVIPPGTIIFHSTSSPPTGWIKANGAAISRTTYASLFSAIGTTFGAGDGSTTFNLPDLRGEFLRGWDDSRGLDSGRTFGSVQEGTWTRQAMDDYSDGDASSTTCSLFVGQAYANADAVTNTPPSGSTTGNGVAFTGVLYDNISVAGQNNNVGLNPNWIKYRPRNFSLLACIKF